MKKMMDIVPRRTVIVEQPKKQKKNKRKIREKVKERVKERVTQRRKKTAVKRARKSERRKHRVPSREKRVKREKRGGVWLFPFSRVVFAIGVLIIILVVIFVVLTMKSKLSLTLTFAQSSISIEDEIKVDIDQTEISVENKAIPGQFFEIEKEKWEMFASTGSVEENIKAEGIIKVYNSHNPPRPVALVVNTRFLSSGGGKIFRAQDKIYLTPATIQGGKVIPSVTEVQVVADGTGKEYNIEPSKFSVPGLAGTALYYTVSGESTEKIQGGAENTVTKITLDDLKSAKTELASILKNSAIVALKRKIPGGFVLDESAIIEEDVETTCFKTVETITPDFNCYGKIKLKGLVFETEHLKNITLGFLNAVVPSLKEIREESLEISSNIKGEAVKAGKMVLGISAEVQSFEPLNKDLLFYQVYGKKAESIRRVILDNFPQIEKVELKFWPFWVKSAPKDIERIKIDLTF